MTITILIMIFGILGILLQYLTRKKQAKEKSNPLVLLQYASMAMIVVLSAYSQYDSSNKEKEYRVAQLKITVLSEVSHHFFPVFENMISINNKFPIINSYLSFEKLHKEKPKLLHSFDWEKNVTKSQALELKSAKKSFQDIQRVAAEIQRINLVYPEVVPKKSLVWAQKTLEMSFSDTKTYFNPYFSKNASVKYSQSLGEAFGYILGEIRKSSKVLASE